MASTTGTNKMKEIATCSICLNLMMHPVSITCGHSYCQFCLKLYFEQMPQNQGEKMFFCPLCREPFHKDSLRSNRQLENLIEVIQEMEEKEDELLCEAHGQQLQLFCEDDGQLICWRCERAPQHQGHNTVLVEDVCQDYKEKLEQAARNLNQLQEECRNQKELITTQITEWKDKIEIQRQKMESEFKNFHTLLHEEEKSYLWRLKKEEEQLLMRLKEREANLEQKSEELKSCRLELEAKRQSSAQKLLQDVKGTLSRTCAVNLEAPEVFSLEIQTVFGVDELYKNMKMKLIHLQEASSEKNKKQETISLTDFLNDSGGTDRGSSHGLKSISWAEETEDLEEDVSTRWHSGDEAVDGAPRTNHSALATAQKPNVDWSHLPKSPPYTAFLGNLPNDLTEESLKNFFKGLNIRAVNLPRDPCNPKRLKGFSYVEFEDLDSLLSALNLNKQCLGKRIIRVVLANQAHQDRKREPDKTDTDWRARPATDNTDDDNLPRRDDVSFGSKYHDCYDSDGDRYQNGLSRTMNLFGNRYHYGHRDSRSCDRDNESRIFNSRKAFGSGHHSNDYCREDGDRCDGRQDNGPWSSRDDYSRDSSWRNYRGLPHRPRCSLKPQSSSKADDSSTSPSQPSRTLSIFGGAKPVDTAAREREVEEKQWKEQEKSWRGLDKPKQRSNWQSEETKVQE
ncbi:PREDICTED: eukaryotic translation initiation factor 4B-like [Chinchilla lanigera]|uniref:eukaryotic translation initiation factor 4B-like n=1 Tax=Chinchilla lanigera TaxID=34839 RepID=UPI00038EA195|nr:PREDICTED: eukaryotic translation initiation factor 4B-like [Chinchilla lanigera]XP_005403373.1 PREDICTED: eukaryotic translation initiation factor 4B-like [Chinchilla lanigera]XP_013359225.1 PREDICTED: eukaryotic translation initiation factor 4B-like [Chinchilla lanigera]